MGMTGNDREWRRPSAFTPPETRPTVCDVPESPPSKRSPCQDSVATACGIPDRLKGRDPLRGTSRGTSRGSARTPP